MVFGFRLLLWFAYIFFFAIGFELKFSSLKSCVNRRGKFYVESSTHCSLALSMIWSHRNSAALSTFYIHNITISEHSFILKRLETSKTTSQRKFLNIMSTFDWIVAKPYLMVLKENLDLTLKWLQLIFVLLRDMARNPRNISHSLFLSRQFCFPCPECTIWKILNPQYFISTFDFIVRLQRHVLITESSPLLALRQPPWVCNIYFLSGPSAAEGETSRGITALTDWLSVSCIVVVTTSLLPNWSCGGAVE
mgnify:CR=1 FL=1